MSEIIEIEGNLVSLVSRTVSRQMSLEDFIPYISIQKPITFPTIARSQVFAHYELPASKMFALCEISPGIRTIRKNMSDGTARSYRLAFPWTYFWFQISGVNLTDSDIPYIDDYRIYFARERYSDINTPMIPALLPNVYSDGRICWGSTGVSSSLSMSDQLDGLVNGWYSSRFNSDLDGNRPYPYGENSFRRWVEESARSATCWEMWPEWNQEVTKVKDLLEEAGTSYRPAVVRLANTIPEIRTPASFGRWEDWWQEIPIVERRRALIAAQNVEQSHIPDTLGQTYISNQINSDDDFYNDGGIEIPYE